MFIVAGDPANSQSLIVDLIPGALSADSVYWIVPGEAATLSVGVDLIHSASGHTVIVLNSESSGTSASISIGVEGGISEAGNAGSIDQIVVGSTGTLLS